MAKLHRISLGQEIFHARSGQLLLDAALVAGVDLPHDCRAGRCGSCLTRVNQGITLGGEARSRGVVHACQARVFSDLALEIEALPPVTRVKATVERLVHLALDIVEVTLTPEKPLDILPGQYCRFDFRGFPARPFSPTSALTAIESDGRIRLNIKQVRDGRVTPQLGKRIAVGHTVLIEGPFGHAFLRPGVSNRLVLVGSGTGFAPVWAVAAAALRENPLRPIVLMATSRKSASFYMAPALELAHRFPTVSVIAAIEELTRPHGRILPGSAVHYLPAITADDIVYAAGAPALVDTVGEQAEAVGATFHADPFEPMAPAAFGWFELARDWLKTG